MQYYILLVLAVLFWSGNFVFGRLVSTSIEPTELSFYRWFFVLVLFLPYILINIKRLTKALKKDFLLLFLLGGFGVAGFNTFLYYGLQTTTAINALLINSAIPIMIVVLSTIILKVKIKAIQVFGIFLSTLGVIYLILKGEFESLNTLEFSKGDLWILLAGLVWSLYSILLKFKPKDLKAFDFLTITSFIGVVMLSVAFYYQGYSFSVSFIENKQLFYSLMYMIIFPSILSFYFWNIATVEVGANKAGQFTHLMPIFGAVLAYFFLGEKLELYHLVGVVFIALGIYLSIFYLKKDKKSE
ncbi:DMT family transporter [Arcobacter sp. YIC-80]|uniref:DMT family transporter n=1 Tax=unclassified Arcobacter TaxID=2593671 RepID=UPI003851164B